MSDVARNAEEASWVAGYGPLVEQALEIFLATGDWPGIDALQRDLDREIRPIIDVREALRLMPRLQGEMRLIEPTHVQLPLRLLRFVTSADYLLQLCFVIVQRALTTYQSDAEPAVVSSDDLQLVREANGNLSLLMRAAQLVADNWPDPLGSGSRGEGTWHYAVNGPIARNLLGIETIGDYFDRQAVILSDLRRRQLNVGNPMEVLTAQPVPRVIFVLMPFSEPWSDGAYDLIRRVVDSLAVELVLSVYRADDIASPGKIPEQVKMAIAAADLIIADITGLNPNVMYELGFADASNKSVVLLNQDIGSSPFDVRDMRQVAYSRTPTRADEQNIGRHLHTALEEVAR